MTSSSQVRPHFPDGFGVVSGQPDLWCTYAAIRSLAWVDRLHSADQPQIRRYIQSRYNRDGGYAWSKGMPSDAWATFYCTETLNDLGGMEPVAEATEAWLDSLSDGRAYGMCAGQGADVWATHYAVRTLVNVCHREVKEPTALLDWLSGLQCENGGLSWSPEFARRDKADVRACFYGVMAWKALSQQGAWVPTWDMERLVKWLQLQQLDCAGFRFSEAADSPCLWATYRATATLAALGAGPLGASDCVDWIYSLRGPGGAFVRWEGYDCEDVWAVFCAVGSLKALNQDVRALGDDVSRFIQHLYVDTGGYTYREKSAAADVLTTAATVLAGHLEPEAAESAVRWIEGCQMPNEAGVMYMPGRGAEVRCTAWALATGAFRAAPERRREILAWLARIQNPDGGFGFWEGRGSDMVSTASAVSIAQMLGDAQGIDLGQLERFVRRCSVSEQPSMFSNFPAATPSFRASIQALKCLQFLGHGEVIALQGLLARHKVKQGGFANVGNRIPDLLSTYEAIAAMNAFGLEVEGPHLTYFLDKVATAAGYAWSPMFREGEDALSGCLGSLLRHHMDGRLNSLPHLYLS
ncbi:terpene cyclase/mutase family protein [Pseudomonas sp. ADAK2]|uniref:prenyltransferase/squalene oxidase repeat-containing protein n=1 Tax=unclassified Pseudomonas TaxID=196821 RepID=UPI0014630FDE|nr:MULTISPECIES: prenyltransferase/squalene oxidase repeat-containing protein [unclassified Pseudomonas]QJI40777.1 terpene cyclase/mutase family protein [Pseudomonas sp. ADAK7]QJI47081.1 terpene cyclase/mutase family protein [Pseudomonas sp. ADAK2]